VVIAAGGALAVAAVWALRRPMTLVAFDAGVCGGGSGYDVRASTCDDGLVMAVTVIGLKIVGLILIVALLIIPPVAARFWTEAPGAGLDRRGGRRAGGLCRRGAVGLGAGLPTGPIIVLVAAAMFVLSLLFAPARGVAAAALRHRRFKARVHRRQGLAGAGAAGADPRALHPAPAAAREGLIRPDGVATEPGRAGRAAKVAARDGLTTALGRRRGRSIRTPA
jgi:manganese/zinc/iron transport system permease protein